MKEKSKYSGSTNSHNQIERTRKCKPELIFSMACGSGWEKGQRKGKI